MAFIVISLVDPDPPVPPSPPATDKEDYITFAGIAVIICESVAIMFEIVMIVILSIHACSCRRTHDQGHHQ